MTQVARALRRILRTPGFAAVTVLTLGVGIAATTALFAVVNAILLRPLPYPDADRLVYLDHQAPGLKLESMGQSDASFLRYRELSRSFSSMAIWDDASYSLAGEGNPRRIEAAKVASSLFATLEIQPALGRGFEVEDERPGAPPVAVLSDALWRDRFAADRGVIGKTIELSGTLYEVRGVLPPGFRFPTSDVELWTPLPLDPDETQLGRFGYQGVGRLADGSTLASAQTELAQLVANLEEAFPGDEAAPVLARSGFVPRLVPYRDEIVGPVEARLWILLGAVGLVLLIACANVANLFLVRSEGRRREDAVRSALGASAWTLARSALAESVLISLLAGGLAVLGAWSGIRLLVRFGPSSIPRLQEVDLDARVLLFNLAIALATGVAFGLIAALRTRGRALALLLRDGGRSATAGRQRWRARHLLVGAQIALALMMLVGSGLMVRSFANLTAVDPGFRAERIVTFRLALPDREGLDASAAARFFQDVIDKLAPLPGVEAAGAVSTMPLSGAWSASGARFADIPSEPGTPPEIFGQAFVAPGYFEAMKIPLREGRLPEPGDHEHRTGAVVINESMAEHVWPNESAIGKRLFPGRVEDEDEWYTVVGVVGDVYCRDLTEKADNLVYYPMASPGKNMADFFPQSMDVVVRTTGDPMAVVPSVRAAIRELDPTLPLARIRTVESMVRAARAPMAFTLVLLMIAAAMSLLLGAVGIFGVMAYLVGQRTAEIGVRVALGARRGEVLGMVLRKGLWLAAGGMAVGLGGAFVLTRWLDAILYHVSPLDPATFAAVPVVLLLVALSACWLPARRAAKIDPIVALRHE